MKKKLENVKNKKKIFEFEKQKNEYLIDIKKYQKIIYMMGVNIIYFWYLNLK